MLTLFHAPASRSTRFIWLLEEMGAPYRIEYVDIQRPDGGQPDPRNPHPHKQVPAIDHDGALVSESTAIALYLTDAFPAGGMGPVVGDPQRGAYVTWLAYYAGVLEPVVLAHTMGPPDAANQKAYDAVDQRIKSALEAGPYLLGERFSAADILFASVLQFGRQLMPPHAVYDEFQARLEARPAFARARAKDAA